MPYSSVGYKINTIDYVEGELSAYYKIYRGSGGINQFYWGHSIKLFKNLGLGMNVSYYLGSIKHSETGTSADGKISYSLNKTSYIHSAQLDYGAQYTFRHKEMALTVGAIYSEQKNLSTTNEVSISTQRETITLDEFKDKYSLPRKYGFGLAFEKGYNFRAGIDYEGKNGGDMNSFKNPLLKTRDGERYSMGFEYTPYRGFRDEGLKRLSYRLGGNYTKSYLHYKTGFLWIHTQWSWELVFRCARN